LRIRHDLVFVACVLFTIALACLIPPLWNQVQADFSGHGTPHGMERNYAQSLSEVAEISLVLVIIGLIVTWTGYLNKIRWTWFVMFILVSGLAILLEIPRLIVHPKLVVETASHLIWAAAGKIPETTPWYFWWDVFIEPILLFFLMVIALFLPVRSFFFPRTGRVAHLG